MANKILSVVVPTYNMEAYLPRCLDSVTRKDVSDTLEVIVVNDGSKDRSLEIAKEYQAKRPDIISIIDKPNGHYGSCINAALKVATGKYFRTLDADDWFDTKTLIDLLSKLEHIESDLIVTNRTTYLGKTKKSSQLSGLDNEQEISINTALVYKKNAHLLSIQCMTWKLSILKLLNIKLIEGICYTDFQLIYYPTQIAKTATFFKGALYNYDLNREGQSMDPRIFAKTHSQMYSIINNLIEHTDNPTPLQESFIYGLSKIYYYRMLFCCKSDNELKTFDKLLQKKFPHILNQLNKSLLYTPAIWRIFGIHFLFYEKIKRFFRIER